MNIFSERPQKIVFALCRTPPRSLGEEKIALKINFSPENIFSTVFMLPDIYRRKLN